MAFTKIVSPGIDTTGSYTVRDLNAVGVLTASALSGPLTGNATGLTGTPDIAVANITATGNVSIGGTLTYEDVTNIDSVGIITAQAGVKVPDSQKIFLGTGDDLRIHHDGTDSYVDNQTGDLILRTSSVGDDVFVRAMDDVFIQPGNGANGVTVKGSGAVELYHNNSLKLQTASGGVNIVGNINLNSADNYEIRLGANNDLKLYHNGTDSYVRDTATGSLILTGSRVIVKNAADNARMIDAVEGGAVKLLHNNVEKLETTSAGLKIHEDTNKVISFSGGIGEIGNVTGFQAINTAASSLVEFGIRAADIRFATGSTERVRITSAGILKVGSNTLVTPSTDADNFVIDTGDVDSGISILSATTGRIYFGDAASNDQGSIRYVHTDNSMRFETNSAERLRITTTGDLDFKTTDGVGINFLESGYINIDSDNNDSSRNFSFYDAKGTGSEKVLMRIGDDGKIGINETSPIGSLHIGNLATGAGNVNVVTIDRDDGTLLYGIDYDGTANKVTFTANNKIFQFANKSGSAETFRIGSAGQIGLAGANYGTAGQVIKSNGGSYAPTWQNLHQFYFYGEQDTEQNVDTATYTRLANLGTNDFSIGDSSIAAFNESNGNLTIGASGGGYYYLEMHAGIDDVQANDYCQAVIGKNGGTTSVGTRISTYGRGWNSGGSNQVVTATTSCIANLSAGDVVRFYVYHNEGSTEPTEPNRCSVMGYKI